jgi:hypothetical protein
MDSRIGRKVFTKCVWIMGIPDVIVVTGIREWIRTATHGFASSTCEGFWQEIVAGAISSFSTE